MKREHMVNKIIYQHNSCCFFNMEKIKKRSYYLFSQAIK